MGSGRRVLAMALVLAAAPGAAGAPPAPADPGAAFRRPVAMVLDGHRLLVGNHDAGTVSVVDPRRTRVVDQWPAGRQVSDLCLLGGGRYLAVADPLDGQLRVLATADGGLVERHAVAACPVRLASSPDGTWLAVALLWARQVWLFRVADAGAPPILGAPRPVDLPFAPRALLWLGSRGRLLVADAFQGRLVAIDPVRGEIAASRSIDGHGISSLVYDPQQDAVLIAHQKLLPNVPTTRDRIFWGQVVSSLLRTVQVDHLLEGNPEDFAPIGRWAVEPLGAPGRGAADPAAMQLDSRAWRVVCLAGVDQLAVSAGAGDPFRTIAVGDHPVALQIDRSTDTAYVANHLDDSVTVVDLARRTAVATIPLGPSPQPDAARRGERLFYDARLSLDGWMSCHSCHTDGHTNGLLSDTFGDDTQGSPKRVPSLLGTAATSPWAWLGHQESLDGQIAKSIRTTMRGPEGIGADAPPVRDLAAYLRTLAPPPSVPRARGRGPDGPLVERGAAIFVERQCADCHQPQSGFTSPDVYDVGLADQAGHTAFNPPALQGVDQRDGWLHDGRARTLREVFTRFGHPQPAARMRDGEIDALIAYLQSL